MHELSLVQSILEKVIEIAQEHGGFPVQTVCIRIGKLKQVVPELLRDAFDIAKQGTLAESAVFEWEEIPAEVRCRNCSHEYEPREIFWVCPACNSFGGELLQGDELILASISVEKEVPQT